MAKKGGFVRSTYLMFAKKKGIVLGVTVLAILIVLGIVGKRLNIFAEVQANCKYLISYGISNRAFPSFIVTNLRNIEQNYPYNGQGIQTNAQSNVMRSTRLNYSQLIDKTNKTGELYPLLNLQTTKLKHNLFQILLHSPGDPFDDTGWGVAADNFATFAQALKELDNSGFGVDGILFDNEGPYDPEPGGFWNYPPCYSSADWTTIVPCNYNTSGRSLAEYQQKMTERGRQIMQAMVTKFPDIKVVIMHSSDISCTDSNLYRFNELIGSFSVGLMEGTYGTNAQLIDGSEESYDFTTEPQFTNRYNYLKNLPTRQPQCSFIPAADRDITNWNNYYKVGHGLYNKQQTSSTIAKAVEYALKHSDNFVWFYVEGVTTIGNTQYYPQIGQDWTNAIAAGRNAVTNDPSCGATTSPTPSSPSPSPSLSPSPSPSTSPSPSPSPSPTLCEPTPAPVLTATASLSTKVDLSWTDTQNENGYSVRRNTTNNRSTATEVYNTHGPNILSWQDTSVSPNTTYWYWVAAYNGCGTGITYSAPVSVTTPIADRPAAPSNLIAAGGSLRADISWSDNSTNESGFRIERKVSSTGSWATLTTLGANTTSYRDSNLTAYTTYYYRVYAYNAAGNSAYSNEDPATALPDSAAPSVPTNLRVVSTTTTQVSIAWSASTDDFGIVGYYIYRNGIKVSSTSSTSYTNTGLSPITTYTYQVSALDSSNNESAKSSSVSATTQPLPDNPPQVAITSPVSGSTVSGTVVLAATASDDKGTSKVDFYADSTFIGSDTTAPYSLSWSTTRYSNGSHTVMARAYDTINQYTNSTVNVTVNNATATITISRVRTSTTSVTATVKWTTSVPSTSQVEYGTTPGYGYSSPLDPNLVTSHSVTITGLAKNTKYYIKIISTAGSSTKTAGTTLKTKSR